MGVWDPDKRALTIGLVMTVTLIAFEGLAVTTIMPAVRADLGGIRLYGWAFSAFFLTSLISTVIAGRAADQQGVGGPFATGVGLFTLGLVVAAAAPSMLVLVLGRAMQGLGAGAVSATAVTTVARGYPAELRPKMFAVMSTAWVVPGLIGPALSGIVADTIGWRWVFAGLLPLIAVSGGIAIPRLRQLERVTDRLPVASSNARTAVVLAIGGGALIAGLGERHLLAAIPLVVVGALAMVPALSGSCHPAPCGAAAACRPPSS